MATGGSTRGDVGRPASLFRFNASIGCVAGVDVGNETVRFVLADLDGRSLAHAERPTSDAEADLARTLAETIRGLQTEAKVPAKGLVGVAVGVPAVVDGSGTIVRASQHHLWEGLALGARLRRALASSVLVRQDDHLAALAELHRGACVGRQTAAVLDVGKGIGVGLVIDGSVHAGAHAAAGRVGRIPIPIDTTDPVDATDLGARLTGDGLVAAYRAAGGQTAVGGAIDVFAADRDGDPVASAAVDQYARRLGWVVAALVAVIDPEIVVIGGGVSRSFARLQPLLEARLAEIAPVPPPVVASTLVPDAVVLGAIDAARSLADDWLRERIGV